MKDLDRIRKLLKSDLVPHLTKLWAVHNEHGKTTLKTIKLKPVFR